MARKVETNELNPVGIRNLRLAEAADALGCTLSWVRREIKAGNLTPICLGKRFLIPLEEVQRYQSQSCQDAGCMSGVK
jgi:excisionase family DNA binding protein